jgi:nucleotide-binding universal stress UspA family protein
MLTRLLVGLDGSPAADVALEQAVSLGEHFHSTVVVAYARDDEANDAALLPRAAERVRAAGLAVEVAEAHAPALAALVELSSGADAVLVGQRARLTEGTALSPTVAGLVRLGASSVMVCAGAVSPMHACAVAFDGGETSCRALELALQFASVVGGTIHVIHAAADGETGVGVVGAAEAALSMRGVPFVTHIESGPPASAVARVVNREPCDAVFAGAHRRREGRPSGGVSHVDAILRHVEVLVVIEP